MNRSEAKTVLSAELAAYRKRSFAALLRLLEAQDTKKVKVTSGKTYHLEFQAVWDDAKQERLRVIGAIDDGGVRAFVPLTDGFIIARDGTFVGEGT